MIGVDLVQKHFNSSVAGNEPRNYPLPHALLPGLGGDGAIAFWMQAIFLVLTFPGGGERHALALAGLANLAAVRVVAVTAAGTGRANFVLVVPTLGTKGCGGFL